MCCNSIIFANVRIRNISRDNDNNSLTLSVVYADREYQRIKYNNVVYSRLDENSCGINIMLSRKISQDELLQPLHSDCYNDFRSFCAQNKCVENDFGRMSCFVNYCSDNKEYLVVAENVETLPV